ncbi:MAG: low-specificity L-threonine aldolase [Shewanella sp.]
MTTEVFDFRSDTVTQPTAAMRAAMANAPVGDDVYGDDPSVNRLEALAAEMLGFDAALFTSSGTQANLLALMGHCERGDEYICGQHSHNYKYEGGGAAVLGSIQPQPLENLSDGTLDLQSIINAIKPDDHHFARTRLISLENTIGGQVLPQQYLADAQQLAFNNRLKIHLDGARLANAAVANNCDMADIAQYFDSVSVCLSKGLAAPVGSLLLGDEALIAKARRWRKVLGGGMRQAGILAAAGELALTTQVSRLAQDHDNAKYLAEQLLSIDELTIDMAKVQTNMVFAGINGALNSQMLVTHLREQGVIISGGNSLRFVLHKDISRLGVDKLVSGIKSFLSC